jgi:hypothetical protein
MRIVSLNRLRAASSGAAFLLLEGSGEALLASNKSEG